ncbi:MAG: YARHG domain-containing protein [Ferruginibacter sp.]
MKAGYLFISVILCALISCNSKNKNANASVAETEEQPVASVNLLGSFVGDFGDNKITLLITSATKDSVAGRSVVGGNDRPFTGTLQRSTDAFTISAKEPGDDKNDGIFDFTINTKTPDEVKGNWKPNNPSTHLVSKDYILRRRAFLYLQDVGNYPEGSKRLLTDEDVDNRSRVELETMRNEIFARHGYCFKKKSLRENFEDKDWYIPNTVDVKKDLTDIEKKNIVLIKKYEKYADDFGDDFGR